MNARVRSVSIAVGVGDRARRRSAVWRVWTNAKQSSVMVALCVSKGIKGGRFKATLERSDTWRLAENVTVARRERPDE
jgi:hypothetical protein